LQDKDYFFSKKVDDGLPENLAAVATAAVKKYITDFPGETGAPDRVKTNMLIENIKWRDPDKVVVTARVLGGDYDTVTFSANKVRDIEN
jgi:hypothetical protein